jgi:hypothetical protein
MPRGPTLTARAWHLLLSGAVPTPFGSAAGRPTPAPARAATSPALREQLTTNPARSSDLGQQAANFLSSFLNYLRTRSPEHWLFFAIGVIVGLLIG